MLKLGHMDGEAERPLIHGKKWMSKKYPVIDAIKIAADSDQIDLMIKLSKHLAPPFYFLYVLLVSRCGHEPGRYQSEPFYGHDEAEIFLKKYRSYFENDGRHNIWLAETDGSSLLVYDHHNFIYGYGGIAPFISVAADEGYVEGDFHIAVPHNHHFNSEFDPEEKDILANMAWKHFPLQEQDDETAG